MTGPTHKVYSVFFSFLTVMLVYKNSLTEIGYYYTLIIILLVSKKGALFPDLDHNWKNIHEKTITNKIINTIIHITGGKHRSYQTHSIDICMLFTVASYFVPRTLFNKGFISQVNMEVISIILLGFASGWISHLFSDMLTNAGIRLFFFIKCKGLNRIKLVPKKIGKIKFNTGEEWEQFNFKIISILNKIIGAICLIYPLFIDGYIDMILNLLK